MKWVSKSFVWVVLVIIFLVQGKPVLSMGVETEVESTRQLQIEGDWIYTGSLTTAREGPTTTLLSDGRVLSVGGNLTDSSTCFGTIEIYDPNTGLWSVSDSMSTVRCSHSATLLPNGKVLVAGGRNSSTVYASSELFDPTTGTWEITGSMNFARASHTATVLQNGMVLVVGGCSTSNCRQTTQNSVEMYDPSTGRWTLVNPMNDARIYHTATSFSNGKVLVAGGIKSFGSYSKSLNTAEIYDPTTGNWTLTPNLIGERSAHTATLLSNGNIMVTGGFVDNFPNTGCSWRIHTIASAEIYDPIADLWSSTNSMSKLREGHTATLLPDGRVMTVGGADYLDNGCVDWHMHTTATAEVYDPENGTWEYAGSLNDPRYNHTATKLTNGDILVVGGGFFEGTWTPYTKTSHTISTAEIFDSPNVPPVSQAGSDQLVNTMTLVTLDGSGSYDPDEDLPLTYLWTQTGGTSVTLDDRTSANPTFTAADDSGTLVFSLVVTDNLGLDSTTNEVSIMVENQAPVADAGSDQLVNTMTLATLDGSGSYDPDVDAPLTYMWIQTSGPTVLLDDPRMEKPSFTAPNAPGTVTFSLVVTDNKGISSVEDEVIVDITGYLVYLPLILK